MQPDIITNKQGGRRKKVSEETKQSIIATQQNNPSLDHGQLAKLHDVSRPFVSILLKENNLTTEEVRAFKGSEADLLTALRYRIYKSITDDEIKKAPVGSRILAYCQIYDKYRLETGQSTDNSNILVAAISDLKRRKSVDNQVSSENCNAE